MSASATAAIAEFACRHDLSGAPDELLQRATRAFVDTIGVICAGGGEDCFTILAQTLESSRGDSTVLTTSERTSAAHAALLNGTAGHALDYDDVAEQIIGHPSIVLVSALLALAESNGSSGRELLEAYAVGFEVGCAIARGLPAEPHYRAGWHATSTIGVLAATAAGGRLLRLDPDRMRNALGIAASMASGSRQNFGTMTKPLHAGLAARDAVIAAQLAGNGFTADPDQLEAPQGYFAMYGHEPQPAAVVAALQQPSVLLDKGLSVKKYPCCYETHRMADAALSVKVSAENVRSVKVTVQPQGQRAIIHHRPTSGLQGKFSGEYVVSACLLDGRVGLASFTDEAVLRPEAQDLLRRVTIEDSPRPPFGPPAFDLGYATVEVTLADDSKLNERCDAARGDARAPLSDAELDTKFRDCIAFGGSQWDADELLRALWNLRTSALVADVLRQPAASRR